MSQYKKIIRALSREPLEIVYGWDDPLKYFYVIVEGEKGELPDALVWSNLRLRKPGLSLGELRVIMEGFDATLTDEEIAQLMQDSDARIDEEPWGRKKPAAFGGPL